MKVTNTLVKNEAPVENIKDAKEPYQTQWKKTLEYLKKYKYITSEIGQYRLGISSFPKRICELTKKGCLFEKRTVPFINSEGRQGHCKEYHLIFVPEALQ